MSLGSYPTDIRERFSDDLYKSDMDLLNREVLERLKPH